MPGSPMQAISRSVVVRTLAVLIAVLLAGTGCDALFGIATEDIDGIWTRSYRGSTVYLHIDGAKLAVHTQRGTCFQSVELQLGFRGDGLFTLRSDPRDRPTYIGIRRVGDELRVGDPGVSVEDWTRWQPGDVDPNGLEECPPGGGADRSIVCSSLPEIHPPQVVRGELSSSDAVAWDGGPYYDLFRLELEEARDIRIELDSDSLYTLLLLYDDGGALLGQSEHHRTTLSSMGLTQAALHMPLDPGCYRIEASTVRSGESGSYFLRVN